MAYWAECSLLLHRYATGDDVVYYHFVQPNQYYPTRRQFTDEERARAINPRSPYRSAVAEGYQRMNDSLVELRAEGVRAEGLFDLLDGLEVPAYVDDCCHFTHEAERYILDHIASRLLEDVPDTPRHLARRPEAGRDP